MNPDATHFRGPGSGVQSPGSVASHPVCDGLPRSVAPCAQRIGSCKKEGGHERAPCLLRPTPHPPALAGRRHTSEILSATTFSAGPASACPSSWFVLHLLITALPGAVERTVGRFSWEVNSQRRDICYSRLRPRRKRRGQVIPAPVVRLRVTTASPLWMFSHPERTPKLLLRLARLRLILLVHEQHAPPRCCPRRSS